MLRDRQWKKFLNFPPGQRFIRWYEWSNEHKTGSAMLKNVLVVIFACLLIVLGMIFWLLPGSGWLLIFLAFFILASRSRKVAVLMDRAELKLRQLIKFIKDRKNN